jgi:hypothetical protein
MIYLKTYIMLILIMNHLFMVIASFLYMVQQLLYVMEYINVNIMAIATLFSLYLYYLD